MSPQERTGDRSRAPVVYYATNHAWSGYQHFYQGLAKAFAGTRLVLYVGPSVPSWPRRHEDAAVVDHKGGALVQMLPNLWVLRARTVRKAHLRSIRPFSDRLLARAIRNALGRLGVDESDVVVWAYTSDAAAFVCRVPGTTSVYWTGDEVIDPFEPHLIRCVDHIFTVSPLAAEQKRAIAGSRVTPMPMAIDPAPFEEAALARRVPPDLMDLPRPILGYGGAVNARLDWDLLRSLAKRTEGSVVVVGPPNDRVGREQVEALRGHPNLRWLGHRDETEAPHYLAAFDVGLIPYRLTPFNVGSNPVKAYQYLAAGIPVVSTRLPALEPLAPLVTFGDSQEQFIAASLLQAAEPRTASDQIARQAVARDYSYAALVDKIDRILGCDARPA